MKHKIKSAFPYEIGKSQSHTFVVYLMKNNIKSVFPYEIGHKKKSSPEIIL